MARGMGSPRRVWNRRRRTHEGPEPACVQTPLHGRVAHAGGEGLINALPWYRLVGVVRTSSETQRRKHRAARKGKWPPSPHLSWKCAQVTGKAGENGRNSGNRAAVLTLDKTVGALVW